MKAIICLIIAATLWSGSIQAHEYNGWVARVVDGDTFDVAGPDGNVRVRLCGIDAPERGQFGALISTQHLRDLIEDKLVRCIQVGQGTPCDRRSRATNRNRIVAQCFYGALLSQDVAREMVCSGHAVDWPRFSNGYYDRKNCGVWLPR